MNPLVSVIVITYNSALHVEETLESVRNQSYKNIELIVSDDASTDNTVQIAQEWAAKNRASLADIKIVSASHNMGIPGNCNQGLAVATGTWVKLIAGDDVLMTNCIEDNIGFAEQHPEAHAVHSQSKYYKNTFEESNLLYIRQIEKELFNKKNISATEQFRLLLQGCHVNTPTVIIKKEIYDTLGNFDEQFRTLEDWPMWVRLSKYGVKFYCLPKPTVKYRVHLNSITKIYLDQKFITNQHKMEREFINKVILPEVSAPRRFFENLEDARIHFIEQLNLPRRNLFARVLNYASFKSIHFFIKFINKREVRNIDK